MRWLFVFLIAAGLAAQAPRIALIELYGVHKISKEKILEALGVNEGGTLSVPKAELQDRVEKVPGVLAAQVQAVCCAENGADAILYVGIEGPGAPHLEFRPAPAGSVNLPAPVSATYHDFASYFGDALRSKEPSGPAADAYRENFEHLARDYANDLQRVLKDSDDADQRAIAAYVLGDGPVTRAVVNGLQNAMRDPDEAVRASAMRSLQQMAPRAGQDPEEHTRIELTWFIELLNSLDWNDRFEASTALVTLTQATDPGTLEQLCQRALPALVDMARWRTPAHAHPAFVLLGRIAGLSDQKIEEAWKRGDREMVVKKALKVKPAE